MNVHCLSFLLALSKLLNSLQENKNEIPSCTEEEFGFLSELLQSKELNALVNVHNKILNNVKDDKFFPVLSNSMDIDIEVLDLLSTKTHVSKDCKELFHLLQKPHIQVTVQINRQKISDKRKIKDGEIERCFVVGLVMRPRRSCPKRLLSSIAGNSIGSG